MREYLSPGVYTQEYDRSFLQSAESLGAAAVFVGGFTKGQAFVPIRIKDTNDLIQKAGQPNGKFYSQYAAYEYSKHKGNFYVQRLLWQDAWKGDGYLVIAKTGSDATEIKVLAALGSTKTESVTLSTSSAMKGDQSGTSSSAPNLKFTIGTSPYTLSYDNIENIESYFGTNPYQPDKDLYCFANYIDGTLKQEITGSNAWTISVVTSNDLFNYGKYSNAQTPWIRDSQTGDKLFRFKTLGDGTYANRQVKIAIENVKSKPQTKFDIIVRKYDDTDKRPEVLEAYYDLNLDLGSNNFVGKRIGDMYQEWDGDANKMSSNGDYPNVSAYIRVQLDDAVKMGSANLKANPVSVDNVPAWYTTASNIAFEEKTITTTPFTSENYVTVYTGSVKDLSPYTTHQGYQTRHTDVRALSNPIPASSTASFTTSFTGNYILVMYGGFDGKNPSTGFVNNPNTIGGQDVTSATSSGSEMYKRAFDMLRNVQEYDIDVVSAAGLNIASEGKKALTEYVIEELCQYRGDCFFVGDAAEIGTNKVDKILTDPFDFDTSYGAVYYPAVKIKCPFTKTFPIVPASTMIPSVIAYTEQISLPHYAPAGINRGTLDVLQAQTKLNKQQRDLLYKNKINPIASFAADGTVVWGQKTLQTASSALDRINVRILVNNIKKWITAYGRTVLFDNNTTTLRAVFTLGAEAYLDDLVLANGLYAYKFVMDESNNTPEVIDRNQLVGELWVKPTRTSEFIILPLNIVRTSQEL